jgi:hypothetical protein
MTAGCQHQWRVMMDNKGRPRAHCRLCDQPFLSEKKSKYNNVVSAQGQSKLEVDRAAQLRILQKAGLIRNLRTQVRYELLPKQPGERAVHYVADFVYDIAGQPGENEDWVFGVTVVEDTKGVRTADYVIKRKLMLWRHGIRIIEIENQRGSHGKSRRKKTSRAGDTGSADLGNPAGT